jgi:pyroglutamyl-peptidase
MCKIHEKFIFPKTLLKTPAHAIRSSAAKPRSAVRHNKVSAGAACVLVTGFEAFGDDPSGQGLNPSAMAAQALDGQAIAGHQVVAAVLPCVFGQSAKVLKALIKRHRPSLVMCVGQAGGRSGISIERIAVNLDDAPLPDNAGVMLRGTAVVARGPAAYFSTLPLQAMLAALEADAVPCELSSSAGHFVCNHVFYALMHSVRNAALPAGFVHVPYLPEQAAAGVPSMALSDITKALRTALKAAITASTLSQAKHLDA